MMTFNRYKYLSEKEVEYIEVTFFPNKCEYTASFTATYIWYWVDCGIGWYDCGGATGIHEDWQWMLDACEISAINMFQFPDGNKLMEPIIKSIDSLDADLAKDLRKGCMRYALDHLVYPKEEPPLPYRH